MFKLVTESGRILLGGETFDEDTAERYWNDFGGVYEDDDTGKEERIYIEEV